MKVIDLLNKIANGKTPPKIKFKNTKPIFEYNIRNGKYEYCYKSNKGKNEICELTFLNLKDEIEIIEEEKKIELPEKIEQIVTKYGKLHDFENVKEELSNLAVAIDNLIINQNEIIDYLKYKEEEKEK
jgi:hypothetical protein